MKQMIIDVREKHEFKSGHVKGAENIPLNSLISGDTRLDDVAKDTQIILYCLSGARASVAVNALHGQGFTNVINGINKEVVKAKYL